MHERPIRDLVDALRKLGARVDYLGREGYPPLKIIAMGLHAGDLGVSGTTSSQYLSALLMTAPLADGAVTVRVVDHLVSEPYVDMTVAIMARFGVRVERQGEYAFHIPDGQTYKTPGRVLVEGDASSASYFLAGAAITGGTVRVEGCGSDSLQGDVHFADVLEAMGARVRWEPGAIEVTGAGPAAGRPLRGIEANLETMPDAAMTLAVAALFAQGPTTLKGIGNWRVKETDRMAAVSRELKKLGAETEVGKDHLTVHPPERIGTAMIETYNDHRMAMAFALAACGPSPIIIENPSCVSKTFPTYFEELALITHRPAPLPAEVRQGH
jgi:3-phosphoshikimate 1-carboxyvinyltransferase